LVASEIFNIEKLFEPLRAESLVAQVRMTESTGAAKPTLPEWFTALPCGQQLGVIIVILLVILSVELPHEVQDQVWGLITTLSAAIWVIQKITKS
jgi:hypothetical protein